MEKFQGTIISQLTGIQTLQKRPRSCSSNLTTAEKKQSGVGQKKNQFHNFYSALNDSDTSTSQTDHPIQKLVINNEKQKQKAIIKIIQQPKLNLSSINRENEIKNPRLRSLKTKINNIVKSQYSSPTNSQSQSFNNDSQDEINLDGVLSNRSRKVSTNSSKSSKDQALSGSQYHPSIFSVRYKSMSVQKPLPKARGSSSLNQGILEQNSEVEEENKLTQSNLYKFNKSYKNDTKQRKDSISSNSSKSSRIANYLIKDSILDDLENNTQQTTQTGRKRVYSQQASSRFQHTQRKSIQSKTPEKLSMISKDNINSKGNYGFKDTNSFKQNPQKNIDISEDYLFPCFDEYDSKHFGIVLNEDSPLDYIFIKDFININQQFVEENLSFQISSLEKIHTNNCKVTIECLMKLKVALKDQNILQKYVKELQNKYNHSLKQVTAVERNKYISSNQQQYESIELNAYDFVNSPFDLVVIVDFKDEFREELIKSINSIISLTSNYDRICLIFPDQKTGRCVRTNLLSCTPQNKSLIQKLFSDNLLDLSNFQNSDTNKYYKMNLGFQVCAFRNAILTLSQRSYTNYQSAIFWFSDGQLPPSYDSINDFFLEFSLQNNSDNHQLDSNLTFCVFHYGNKKQIDDTLEKISQIKNGKYFYVVNIDNLHLIVNQAMNDLQAYCGFQVVKSIDLIEHSQIKVKEAPKEEEEEIQVRSRETSIMKTIHPKMMSTFNSLYPDNDQNLETEIKQNQQKNNKNEMNLKDKIIKAQSRGQKLFTTEITKLYGGSVIWTQQNNTSSSVRFSHLRHGVEKNSAFQILLKPSSLLAQCDVAEFSIINGTCLLLPSPHKQIQFGNKQIQVQYLKKFSTCNTQIHFHLNEQQMHYNSKVSYNVSSKLISYDQSHFEKKQTLGADIMKHVSIQDLIESFQEKIKLFQKLNTPTSEIRLQIEQTLNKYIKFCSDSFCMEIESYLNYIKENGFDIRAVCYLKCIVHNYKFQSRVLFQQLLNSPYKTNHFNKIN